MATSPAEPFRNPRQFRLRSVAIAFSLFAILFSLARHLPAPTALTYGRVLEMAILIAPLTYCVYRLAGIPVYDSPLVGGWFGTVFGCAVVSVLSVGLYRYQESGRFFDLLFTALTTLLQATIVSPAGLAAALTLAMLRKKHDVWSGGVCGAVVGLSLNASYRFQWTDFVPALLVGMYGAWGSAMQTYRSRARQRALPPTVDEVACQTVAQHPTPRRTELIQRASFRVRKVLTAPARWRNWWPF